MILSETIQIYGDSNTACNFSPTRGMFAKRIEKLLEQEYVRLFESTGMSKHEAQNHFRVALETVREEAKLSGEIDYPEKMGDYVLQTESSNENTRMISKKSRDGGASSEDIRWWWNLHYLERGMMIFYDNMTRMNSLILSVKEGMDKEGAVVHIRKIFPIYGDPTDTSNTTGDDRPLPYEIKDRINKYILKRMQHDPEHYKKEINTYSTLNALLRAEIQKGNI